MRLAVERLIGAHGGAKPRWINLDSQVNSLEAVATLAAACKGTPSLVTLSLRYCALPDDALDALVELVNTNVNLETLYLHEPSTALNCASPLTGKAAKWASTGRTWWQQSVVHV